MGIVPVDLEVDMYQLAFKSVDAIHEMYTKGYTLEEAYNRRLVGYAFRYDVIVIPMYGLRLAVEDLSLNFPA